MAKLTLDDLRKLRDSQRQQMSKRAPEAGSAVVIVGMGTCGIAAGSKQAFDAFANEIDERGLQNVVMKQTGCMGLCHSEPTARVVVNGMPEIIYGNVTPEVARQIVREHIVKGELVNDHIFDQPATDIIKE
jgi:NADP-reducing hydrogenase subunit HndB